jgi:hypothetical protein
MKSFIIISFGLLMLTTLSVLIAQTPEWEWVTKGGGTGVDYAVDIALDNAGNSYVIGSFSTTATFGTSTIISNGNLDIVIAKMDPLGNWLWAVRGGGTGIDYGGGIAVDGQGNCYVTGMYSVNGDFGPFSFPSVGNWQIFLAKLDTNGNWLWAKNAGGPGGDMGNGICLDSSGNCYATGYFTNPGTFGPFILTAPGAEEIYVTKLDTNGNWLWAQAAQTTGGSISGAYTQGRRTAVDNAGNCYVTGNFCGTSVFGSVPVVSAGYEEIFVARLDPYGNWLWAKAAGGINPDIGYSVALDGTGNCYVSGGYSDAAIFGTLTLTSYGSSDIFAAKLDSNGNWLWARNAGDISSDSAWGMAVDNAGNSYLTGLFYGTANFGSIALVGDIYYTWYSLFVSKLDTSGNWLWAIPVTGTRDEKGYSVALGNDGLRITGSCNGTSYWGDITVPTGGGTNVVIAKLSNPTPTVPVELSSFTAALTAEDAVQINWTSESETQMLGYLVYRNTGNDLSGSYNITPVLIPATNTSTQHSYSVADAEVEAGNTYYYWLEGIDFSSSEFYGPISVTVNSNTPPTLPELTSLRDAYPNPFRIGGSTNIGISLKAGETGTVSIYNLLGQIVKTYNVSEGTTTIIWDGKDVRGNICSSGVYFYKLSTPSCSQTRKLVVLK